MTSDTAPVDLYTSPWHLLGVGSLGGLWAMHLHSQINLRLLLRQASQSEQSLQLLEAESSQQHAFAVEASQGPGAAIQHLIVATKSYDVLPALELLRPRLQPQTEIFLLQNGLGSQDQALAAFPNLPLYAVTTTEGANQPQRFQIRHAGHGQTWIGPLNDAASLQRATQVAALFQACGLQSQATADIRAKLWDKLAINCAINPFTAILDCANGELPQQEFFCQRIDPLCREIATAMSLAGYTTDSHQVRQRVDQVIAATARNISSMLQDMRAGRRTEIDAINGYLQEFCSSQGLATPINTELCRLVKKREAV